MYPGTDVKESTSLSKEWFLQAGYEEGVFKNLEDMGP